MNTNELTILLKGGKGNDELRKKILKLAPGAKFLIGDDIERDESLLAGVDIVYGTISPAQFARAENLKWLQTLGAGVSWTQTPEVLAHPAVITNARIHAVQISEHLFGLLLMLTRRLDKAVRWQAGRQWKEPEMDEMISLPGKTLCVLGLGVIGRRCAMLGAAHGMRVIGVKRNFATTDSVDHVEKVYTPDQLDEALSRADIVMNLIPGTAETFRMISKRQFDAMPDSSYFLNAGRGATVDTNAIIEALRSGKLAGAGLDVMDPEPLPADHPLWDAPNVIITAHYSGVVDTYYAQTKRLFLENFARFLAGEALESVIDKKAGY